MSHVGAQASAFANASADSPQPWRRRLAWAFVFLVLAASACGRTEPTRAPSSVQTEIPVAIAPHGETSWPIVFKWSAVSRADAIYRVVVTDAAERPLAQWDTRGTELTATPDLRPMLQGPGKFYWQVGVVTPTGEAGDRSARIEFHPRAAEVR